MKEEELIKKLENVEPPTIEMESHRQRLKMALLGSGHPQGRRGWRGLSEGARETVLKILKSPQPLWKPLAFGAMALALVIGLTWVALSPNGQSQLVVASDTIMINPEISATSASEGWDRLEGYGKIELMLDGEPVVIVYHFDAGNRTLTVNLEARELSLAEINQLGHLELSESDEQKAIDIARADTEVNELLAQGATIAKVIMEYIPYFGRLDSEIVLDGAVGKITQDGAIILLEQGDEHWLVHIDLVEGIVKSLVELTE
jgi:hypothetical protein